MTRLFDFSDGEYYHLYNRGIEKRIIFLDNEDYDRFTKLLYICNGDKRFNFGDIFDRKGEYSLGDIERGERLLSIGAWCLMPNHFHLLVKETCKIPRFNLQVKPRDRNEVSGISLFMQKILTAYSMYFNKKYKRKGSLFEGTFNAKHANDDRYLKYLYSYIHLNPIGIIDKGWKVKKIISKENANKYIKNYKYSSYFDYSGLNRPESEIINPLDFPEYFMSSIDFKKMVGEWINFENPEV